MSVFLCLVRTDGAPLEEAVCRKYGAKREVPRVVPPSWCRIGEFAVMLGSDVPGLEPQVARYGDWLGTGIVRLDQHRDLTTSESGHHADHTDLDAVLRTLDTDGVSGVRTLVGDFSFVAWNRRDREAIAARDSFGVRRLYMSRHGALLAFSTRASLLAESEDYDLEYFAEFLLNRDDTSGRTAFRDVGAVRSAEVVTYTAGRLHRMRYWTPPVPEERGGKATGNVVEQFSELFFDAVATRLTRKANVWSHLTGGMDSSSVVGAAHALATRGSVPFGVAGTITYQATPPLGSDVEHARTVATHLRLRHEVLDGWWQWQDDGVGPPLLDLPGFEQVNYALERRVAALVQGNGGQIILTGVGGDLYLRPQFETIADLLARLRIRKAMLTLAHWSIATRHSFWHLLFEHGILPLLPRDVRYLLAKPELRVPTWISDNYSKRFDLRGRAGAVKGLGGKWGMKAHHLVAEALFAHASWIGRERIGEPNVEWRHPFFHRPLVEFGLRLPPEWRVAPGSEVSKRVLRDAMTGILPDSVRLRRGKGALRPDTRNALKREARHLLPIARHPVLAELGCVEPHRFARAVSDPDSNRQGEEVIVNSALTLEFWIRRRLERWS